MAYEEAEARKLVTESARRLLEEGLVARTWGNISARISDTRFVITPSGMGYEQMRPQDLVLVNMEDGSWNGDRKPSSEKGIHSEVYRLRPEVNFVIHTHQEAASICGISGEGLAGLNNECLGSQVPCAAYGMPSTGKLCRAVSRALEDAAQAKAVLMKHHGALCLGKDSREAFAVAMELERVCRERIEAAGEKSRRTFPPQEDYGNSVRKGRKFCLYRNGEKTVYNLKKLPEDLPEAAAIHAEIYRNTEDSVIIWTGDPAVRAVSAKGRGLHPCLEDLIQIAGAVIPCAGGYDPVQIGRKIRGKNAVLVFEEGAFCTGKSKEDARAVKTLLEKGCRAALYADAHPGCHPVNLLDGWIQRLVYVKKYARKKEEGA